MTTTLRAITAFAHVAAFESSEKFLAFSNAYVFFLPQSEGAYRRGRIASAVFAVAVTHLERLAAQLDFHRSTVTLTCMYLRHLLFAMAQSMQDLQDSIASGPSIRHERPILRLVTRELTQFALIPCTNAAR